MKVNGNGQGKILSTDELRRLFTEGFSSPRDRARFGICLFTGCRVSEALALQTTDIKGEVLTFSIQSREAPLAARHQLSQNWTALAQGRSAQGTGTDLRDIAMELGVAILILHHENKTGGVRGSTGKLGQICTGFKVKCGKSASIIGIDYSSPGKTAPYLVSLD